MARTSTVSRGDARAVENAEIIDRLNAAVAAEMQAAYRYMYYSKWIAGDMSRELAEMFDELANDEFDHAKHFMRRVIELGGDPVRSPEEWANVSYAAPSEMPEEPADYCAAIADAVRLEADAVEFYRALAADTRESDPVTWRLATESLADEIQDKTMLEKLLRMP